MSRHVLLRLIDLYQKGISPLTLPSCRFSPSCSTYAYRAIDRFGVFRGGWMFLRRFCRCHPFGGNGYDPVPDRALTGKAEGSGSR